jgi:uncharacterized protein
MAIAFDPRKSAKNIEERGLSFELAHSMEWETALIIVDDRKDYGETRCRS